MLLSSWSVTSTDRAPNTEQVIAAWPRPGQARPQPSASHLHICPIQDIFFLSREKIKEMKLTIDISSTLQIGAIRKINPSPDSCLLLMIRPTIAPPLFPLLDRRQETTSQQDKMPDYVNQNDDTREHKLPHVSLLSLRSLLRILSLIHPHQESSSQYIRRQSRIEVLDI